MLSSFILKVEERIWHNKEQKEIALFESYLPQQLSDEELQAALKEMIANLGLKTDSNNL